MLVWWFLFNSFTCSRRLSEAVLTVIFSSIVGAINTYWSSHFYFSFHKLHKIIKIEALNRKIRAGWSLKLHAYSLPRNHSFRQHTFSAALHCIASWRLAKMYSLCCKIFNISALINGISYDWQRPMQRDLYVTYRGDILSILWETATFVLVRFSRMHPVPLRRQECKLRDVPADGRVTRVHDNHERMCFPAVITVCH